MKGILKPIVRKISSEESCVGRKFCPRRLARLYNELTSADTGQMGWGQTSIFLLGWKMHSFPGDRPSLEEMITTLIPQE